MSTTANSVLHQSVNDPEVDLADALGQYVFSGLDSQVDTYDVFKPGSPATFQTTLQGNDSFAPELDDDGQERPSELTAFSLDVQVGSERGSNSDYSDTASHSVSDDGVPLSQAGKALRTAVLIGGYRNPRNTVDHLPPVETSDTQGSCNMQNLPPQDAGPIPSYMQRMYGPPDIVYDSEGRVQGGSLRGLIEHLTLHDLRDSMFHDTFMMTFESFATSDEIITELLERFNIPQPAELSADQASRWTSLKQKIIRFRVLNVLKALVQSVQSGDVGVLGRVKTFAESIEDTAVFPARDQLLQCLRMQADDFSSGSGAVDGQHLPARPSSPTSTAKLQVQDVIELARQLTVMESCLFSKVRPADCLNRGLLRARCNGTDNVKNIIDFSNSLAVWVTYSIVVEEESQARASIIEHFIKVIEHCKGLQNYSTMSALMAGLNSPPVRRLKRTWDLVNPTLVTIKVDLEGTLDAVHGFEAHRRMLQNIDPPCVPFFGMYLTSLRFVADGNKDFIKVGDVDVINFDKRQRTVEIIREIQKLQFATYDLSSVNSIMEFIEKSFATSSGKNNELWQRSLKLEPRQT